MSIIQMALILHAADALRVDITSACQQHRNSHLSEELVQRETYSIESGELVFGYGNVPVD